MKDNRIPEDDQKRSILFWVPTPETAPGLVRPDSTENRRNQTEQQKPVRFSLFHNENMS